MVNDLMNNKKFSKILTGMIYLAVLILIVPSIIKLFTILHISRIIILNQWVSLFFAILFLTLDITRMFVIIILVLLIPFILYVKKKYKLFLLIPLFLDFILTIVFLVRFIVFICFAPLYSFISFPFILLSLIILKIISKKQEKAR